ncbi:MAG: 50S ribosomal protein L1 [Candidatus Gygaella obscura]|nr:50S ribosomal protein L1 [Candidatus Gygaella obscura]
MKKFSKRHKKAQELVDVNKIYTLKDAVDLLKKTPKVKFDESVELHFYLNIDSKKSDQMVRGGIKLPHGTGKKIKVAVICKGEHETQAKEAGADFIGGADLIEKISGGWMEFDKIIAIPEMMKDLAKLGKVLGPRGLMPSPKTGSVTTEIAKAVKEAKAGKIDFKSDKLSGIHVGIGRISFSEDQIIDNAKKVLEVVQSSRPSTVKGNFIKKVFISATMSPALQIN